jgi:sugar phosphate permease
VSFIKIVISFVLAVGLIGSIFLALGVTGVFGIIVGTLTNFILPGWGNEILSWGRLFLAIPIIGGIAFVLIALLKRT